MVVVPGLECSLRHSNVGVFLTPSLYLGLVNHRLIETLTVKGTLCFGSAITGPLGFLVLLLLQEYFVVGFDDIFNIPHAAV